MRMKTWIRGLALSVLAFGNLAGCTPAAQEGSRMTYAQNPNPTQAYRVRMRIDGAPGPFAAMKVLAQYDVVNKDCLPPPDTNPGGYSSPVPSHVVEIQVVHAVGNEYEGVVYADRMRDEDYYGRGVCRWALVDVRARLRATGAPGETLFLPAVAGEDVLAGVPWTIHFVKKIYPGEDHPGYPVIGVANRSRMTPTLRDEDLFTVTFTSSKEASP